MPTEQQLLTLGFGVALSMALMGCVGSKAYPGPALAIGEVGVVAPAVDEGAFQTTFVAVLQINGQEKLEEWFGGTAVPVYLLPGDYQFRVEYKQNTSPGLVGMAMDAAAASAHAETTIAFPVKAGMVHRIHYSTTGHLFLISRGPATEPVQPATMWPQGAAAPCVKTPDRTEDLWCELRP